VDADKQLEIVALMASNMTAGRAVIANTAAVIASEAWMLFNAVKKAEPERPKPTYGSNSFNR
jgi:hypothetical protein